MLNYTRLNMKKLTVAAFALLATGNIAVAQDAASLPRARSNWDALQGIAGVNFSVVVYATVDNVAIRKMLEAKLQEKKIRVGNREPISLEIFCVAMESPSLSTTPSTCTVRVMQAVTRSSPTPLQIIATIWQSKPNIQNFPKNSFAMGFSNTIETLMDAFLEDWTKANPAQSPPNWL